MLGHRALELEDYREIFKRRRVLILTCVLIFPILAAVATRFLRPKYLSQTLVLVEEQKVPDAYVKPVIGSNLDSRLSSMKEQILSRSRIQPIIEKYNLYGPQRLTMDDRVDLARKAIDIKPIRSAITTTGGLPGFFITFTAGDAHTAQLVCGEITNLFMNENLRAREASAEGTTDFLKGQLADAKRNLDEQDARLAAFQRQYFGKLPTEELGNMNMLTSMNTQLEAATQALARMEQDKTYAESMLAQQQGLPLPSSPNQAPAPALAPAEALEGTPAQRFQLQKLQDDETDLLTHYTAEYPDVIALRRHIADLKRQMKQAPSAPGTAAAASIAPSSNDSPAVQQLRSQIRAAAIGIQEKRREQDKIQAAVRMYQDRIQSSPQVEEEYKALTRDYDTARKFYDDLNTKMNQSKMATDLERRQEGEQFRVMDEPNLPDSPTFPKLWVFVLGGLVFGLVLGAAIAGMLEYKDTSMRSERDIWAFTHLPTLGVISVAGAMPEDKPRPGFFARFKRIPARKRKALLADARG